MPKHDVRDKEIYEVPDLRSTNWTTGDYDTEYVTEAMVVGDPSVAKTY